MGGPGSGAGGPGVGERFAGMVGRDLNCRCSRGHCSPSCEACRIWSISRCPTSLIRKARR